LDVVPVRCLAILEKEDQLMSATVETPHAAIALRPDAEIQKIRIDFPAENCRRDELMKISCQFLVIGILYLMPWPSTAQEVVPYADAEVKVDWVRGTDFSQYKSYAWGTPDQKASDPNHPIDDIAAALQAKGLQRVSMDANPDLIVAFRVGNKQIYVLQNIATNRIVKQGTLVVELADRQTGKDVWWAIGKDTLTGDRGKDLPIIQKAISKMFKKYPPPPAK
jgi:hypothetical protein